MVIDMKVLTATISYLTVILSAIGACYKVIKTIDKLREDFNENTLLTYKLVIMSDKVPLEEKLEAGSKYISLGGNGAVKEYIRELERQQYEEIFNSEEDK